MQKYMIIYHMHTYDMLLNTYTVMCTPAERYIFCGHVPDYTQDLWILYSNKWFKKKLLLYSLNQWPKSMNLCAIGEIYLLIQYIYGDSINQLTLRKSIDI